MPKKKNAEEKENEERWLLTYADLITLLMAFFCILFAMANVDAVKFKAVAQSMGMALGGSGGGGSGHLSGGSGSISPQIANIRQTNDFKMMIKLIREFASQKGLSESIKMKPTSTGLIVSLQDSILFSSGSADLSPQARVILDKLAEILFIRNYRIRVEGHTDNVPIHSARYQSNWQLSTDRATNVIMYWLSKNSEQAVNLAAAGYGEFHPVVPNDTEEGRATNRRVEIIVVGTANPAPSPIK